MGIFSQYLGLRKENYILVFGRMMTNLGSMVFPILTLILTRKMGLSATAAASVMTVAGLIMVPAGMLGGKLADTFSKRWIIVLLDLVSIVTYCTSAFLPLNGRTVILLIVASVAQHMENPAYHALIADINPTADRERAFSLMYLACNLGLVASPTIAGILFEKHLSLCFLINGLCIFGSTFMILFFLKDLTPVAEESAGGYQDAREGASIWTVLKENRLMWVFLYIMGIYFASYSAYMYLLPMELGMVHGDRGALIYGSITSICCIVVVIFTPIFTKLFSRLCETRKITLGEVFQLLGYGLFLAALTTLPGMTKLPAYYMAMTVFTFGEILETIVMGTYTAARIPASHRGRISGVLSVVQNLLQSGILMITGILYDRLGRGASWSFVFLLLTSAILVSLLLQRWDRIVYPAVYSAKQKDGSEDPSGS